MNVRYCTFDEVIGRFNTDSDVQRKTTRFCTFNEVIGRFNTNSDVQRKTTIRYFEKFRKTDGTLKNRFSRSCD